MFHSKFSLSVVSIYGEQWPHKVVMWGVTVTEHTKDWVLIILLYGIKYNINIVVPSQSGGVLWTHRYGPLVVLLCMKTVKKCVYHSFGQYRLLIHGGKIHYELESGVIAVTLWVRVLETVNFVMFPDSYFYFCRLFHVGVVLLVRLEWFEYTLIDQEDLDVKDSVSKTLIRP